MEVLSWHEVDLGGVILAGLVAGYMMALVGLWAGRVPGLAAVDIADYGRRYMVSDRPSVWLLGMASHLANSFLLMLRLGNVDRTESGLATVARGTAVGRNARTRLAGGLVAPFSGQGFMGLAHRQRAVRGDERAHARGVGCDDRSHLHRAAMSTVGLAQPLVILHGGGVALVVCARRQCVR